MAKNVREIVVGWLMEHKYDGLFAGNEDCACEISDLMPCDGDMYWVCGCEPGYKLPCDGECDQAGYEHFHIGAKDARAERSESDGL